jgi:hypothetical protein
MSDQVPRARRMERSDLEARTRCHPVSSSDAIKWPSSRTLLPGFDALSVITSKPRSGYGAGGRDRW